MPVTTRRAVPSDIDWLMGQLRQFARFYGTKRSLFPTDDYAEQVLESMVSSQAIFMAVETTSYGEQPIGFIAAMVGVHPYNPTIRLLAETFWWVEPTLRGGRAALLLLEAFKAWGVESGFDWLTLSMVEGKSPLTDRTLERHGFRLHEKSYLREVG